jgi:hypothetical protein
MLLIDIKRLDMGPANLKWVQYYFLVKCVGFETNLTLIDDPF